MVVIRLARGGRKKNSFYRIVVADCRHPRDGQFIECVGYYNPMARGCGILLQVERERIVYWLGQGAQATSRVQHLIKKFEKLPEKAKEGAARSGSLRKSELKYLQAEQQSVKAQKTQAEATEGAATKKKAKAEKAPAAK